MNPIRGDHIFLPSAHFGYVEHEVLSTNERNKECTIKQLISNKVGTISFEACKYYSVADLPYENRTQRNMNHF